MQRRKQYSTGLECADDLEVEVAPPEIGVETSREQRVGHHRHPVVGGDSPDGLAVLVVFAVILDLYRAYGILVSSGGVVLAGLEYVHVGVALLPESVIFVVVDTVDRPAYEPAVSGILATSVGKGDELVLVGVEVHSCRPGPVSPVYDGSVERKLYTAVLGLAEIGGIAADSGR